MLYHDRLSYRKISLLYLLLVPVIVTVLAFVIGHVSYKIYIPSWLINASIMIVATQTIQGKLITDNHRATWFLIAPWALVSIFGGMGPPPETPAAWAALATEQVCRYSILILSGISMAIGFIQLHKLLAQTRGKNYASYGKTMICIALPLFVLNMAYWGFFLTHVFVKYSEPGHPVKPGWIRSVGDVFTVVRMTEVTLIYLATAAMSFALYLAKLLSKKSTVSYITFACLGTVFNLLPASVGGPLAVAAYLSIIPAITLLMPYLLGVNLLYRQSFKKLG
ncbi:hypothetical protein ACFQZX_03840 [Mucilaginibacter litoreus]|uniref:Uncharacterized protein n=1 Tax=Mucilaginibacter litoreus TaxID=1048221 RepID=A0ABW3AQV8_9SPHI